MLSDRHFCRRTTPKVSPSPATVHKNVLVANRASRKWRSQHTRAGVAESILARTTAQGIFLDQKLPVIEVSNRPEKLGDRPLAGFCRTIEGGLLTGTLKPVHHQTQPWIGCLRRSLPCHPRNKKRVFARSFPLHESKQIGLLSYSCDKT